MIYIIIYIKLLSKLNTENNDFTNIVVPLNDVDIISSGFVNLTPNIPASMPDITPMIILRDWSTPINWHKIYVLTPHRINIPIKYNL